MSSYAFIGGQRRALASSKAPTDFAHGELYLDSRLGLGSFADNANVTAWPDQSGHTTSRDAIHNSIDPKMGRSGSNLTPKGQPTVVWGTANDAQGLISRTSFVWTDPGTRGWTLYWYGKAAAKAAPPYSFVHQAIFGGDATAPVHFVALVDTGAGRLGIQDDAGGGNPHAYDTLGSIAGGWHLHTLVLPAPNNNTVPARYYLDGVAGVQNSGPAAYQETVSGVTPSSYALGNSMNFNVAFDGNIGFLAWFSDTHAASDIAALKAWTSATFGF